MTNRKRGNSPPVQSRGTKVVISHRELLRRAGSLESQLNIMIRLNKRLSMKLWIINPKDDIFTDGTFTERTLDVIAKEAEVVLEAIRQVKLGEAAADKINARTDAKVKTKSSKGKEKK